MNISRFLKFLQKSWFPETSKTPEKWSEENPAIGQCAVTALVVQDYFGGEIVWAEVVLLNGEKVSHYFNLIDGEEIDLTRSQFPVGSIIPRGVSKTQGFASTREYMLSDPDTVRRYELLKEKVQYHNRLTGSSELGRK